MVAQPARAPLIRGALSMASVTADRSTENIELCTRTERTLSGALAKCRSLLELRALCQPQ